MANRPPVVFAETEKQARQLMNELYREAYIEGKITAVDTEFVPISHEPVLMSYSWGRGIRRVVRAELVKDFFGDWLVDDQTKLAWQNYKEDAETCEHLGIPSSELQNSFYIDVMVAGVLRDETLVKHGLKAQMFHFLKWFRREYGQLFCYVPPGKKLPIVMDPRQVMDGLPPEALLGAVTKWSSSKGGHKTGPRTREEWIALMLGYAGDDAEGTQLLAVDHRSYLKKTDYWQKYVDVDRQFTLTLMQCEESGALIDQPTLRKILRKQEIRILRSEHCFRAAAGNPKLNLRSGPQMKKLLIEEWGWPAHPDIKSEKTGEPGMDKEVLQWWLQKHKLEMAEVKLAFNNASTMKGTFLQGLLDGVSDDGRLRSDLNQIGGKTCLEAGELVLTSRGYLSVEDVEVGDLVLTHEGRGRAVHTVVDNGVKDVYEVALDNGLRIHVTDNHPFAVVSEGYVEWQTTVDINIGDDVAVRSAAEQWLPISGWYPFEVSSWGRVRNSDTGRVLALQIKNKNGHLKVTLMRNGAQERGVDRRDFNVHRLVMMAFRGRDPVRSEVRHLNGIGWDNSVENLAWGTRTDNAADMVLHNHGGRNNRITLEDVELIRSTVHVRGGRGRRSSDATLAKIIGCSRENVSAVRLGRSWTRDRTENHTTEFDIASVVSVTRAGRGYTYGLMVEDDHSHVTAGILTHNSGRISSRKFDVLIEEQYTLKSGEVKTRIKKKKVGANLQNIPARKEKDPDGIRGAFRAPDVGETTAWGDKATEPHVLCIADYSGFHLVLCIHWLSKKSKQSAMLDIMKKYGTPSAVHVYTTIQMFKHVKPHKCTSSTCVDKKTGEWKKLHGPNKSYSLNEFTMDDWKLVKPIFPDQYTYAKNTTFALIFKGSPWTLAYNTGRDPSDPDQLDESKRLYGAWHELYPEIETHYQRPMIDHAYEHGWVPTIGGRRGNVKKMLDGCDRTGKYIHDDDKRKRMIEHGERVATNTPCQGSEADIVKMAMNLIATSQKLIELRHAPLFPVHDEVVCESPKSVSVQGLEEQIRLMKLPYRAEMDFELAVEGGIGVNWLSGKP